MNYTDPSIKFRYARGLGDIIACCLHSKPLGWITRIITGKDKPCIKCTARADALNILVPIPFWKLFFDSNEELIESLQKDYALNGWDTNITVDKKGLQAFKVTSDVLHNKETPQVLKSAVSSSVNNEGTLVGSSETRSGDFLIKIFIYKN